MSLPPIENKRKTRRQSLGTKPGKRNDVTTRNAGKRRETSTEHLRNQSDVVLPPIGPDKNKKSDYAIDNVETQISRSKSKSLTKFRKASSDSIRLSDTEDDYPPPFPPKRRKHELFKIEEFKEIDDRAAKASDSVAATYESLLEYLLSGLDNDLQKVRAIFRWLVAQKQEIPVLGQPTKPRDGPLHDFSLIQQRKFSYQEMFALLCRKARLKCALIHGIAKSIAYEVGDKIDAKKLKNKWNAVYVDRSWHLVHPYWASRSTTGYSTGEWTIVESNSWHDRNSSHSSPKSSRTGIGAGSSPKSSRTGIGAGCSPKSSRTGISTGVNEFYFLTDPDKFIVKCFPSDPRWQLLTETVPMSFFEECAYLQPSFYDYGLNLLTHDTCILSTDYGECEIKIQMPKKTRKDLSFGYKLYKHSYSEDEGEYEQLPMDRYLVHHKEHTSAVFIVRFPLVGEYKLELHCNDPHRRSLCDWIVDYKIVCGDAKKDCVPLPYVPPSAWGPTSDMESAGIVPVSHLGAMISLDDDYVTELKFKTSRDTEFKKELLHYNKPKSKLAEYVTEEVDGDEVTFRVRPPAQGEYAFRLMARDTRNGKYYKNIANYLLDRKSHVEAPNQVSIRKELIKATENAGYKTIQAYIDKFEKEHMEDMGDLTKAKKRFLHLQVHSEMDSAMKNKDLEQLEKLMAVASDPDIRREMAAVIDVADEVVTRLRRLKRLKKEVLEMDAKTISELRSYMKPPAVVHGVMAATFMLLGNKEADLKRWIKIQSLISKKGKDGLKRRVANFNSATVPNQVLMKVKSMLRDYDTETVQIASAGASTFYNWVTVMIGEIETERQSRNT